MRVLNYLILRLLCLVRLPKSVTLQSSMTSYLYCISELKAVVNDSSCELLFLIFFSFFRSTLTISARRRHYLLFENFFAIKSQWGVIIKRHYSFLWTHQPYRFLNGER